MAKLSALELWRLADDLSVENAAILIAGGDPGEHYVGNDGDRHKLTWQVDGFEAAFQALRNAIKTNRVRARINWSARQAHEEYIGDYTTLPHSDDEAKFSYDMLIARHNREGETKLNFSANELRADALRKAEYLFVWKEPNWSETTVDVEDLKGWLEERGVYPEFFFPKGGLKEFTNKTGQRYSAKLACAMAAWENVTKPAPNKSVKQTLQDWVQSNGINYGLGEGGVVSQTAAEEIAKIANWNVKGGANPTASSGEAINTIENAPVDNYYGGYRELKELDDDVPF